MDSIGARRFYRNYELYRHYDSRRLLVSELYFLPADSSTVTIYDPMPRLSNECESVAERFNLVVSFSSIS